MFLVSCDGLTNPWECYFVRIILQDDSTKYLNAPCYDIHHPCSYHSDLYRIERFDISEKNRSCDVCESFCTSRSALDHGEICKYLNMPGNNFHVRVETRRTEAKGNITFKLETARDVVQFGK